MNILKHMEAVFIAAAVLATAAGYATAGSPALQVAADTAIVARADTQMAVVTVSAKRLSAAEKATLI
jgi:hypothetical protein